MRTKFFISLLSAALIALTCDYSFAAVGCTLNDPDRDIVRIFPDSTGYRSSFMTIEEMGGEQLYKKIQQQLGYSFDQIYESIDVPYAYYDILKGKEVIGLMHGVNQKGTYGGMQLIIATDLRGRIIAFYYQRLSSPEAKLFKDKGFTDQFKGLALPDLLNGTVNITDPSKNSHEDFENTLKGIKKNLLLLEAFILKERRMQ